MAEKRSETLGPKQWHPRKLAILTPFRKTLLLLSLVGVMIVGHNLLRDVSFDSLPSILDILPFHENGEKYQCTQFPALYPAHKTNELAKMDDYLRSEEFRNSSIARLSGAVQIPSISYDDLGAVGEDKRWDVFYDLSAYLMKSYPLVHQTMHLDRVNTHGLAYTWLGSDTSLKPLLLMAHQDVVPVPEDTIKSWTHAPFSGYFDGKLIWGRGSADCKNSLTGILESLEQLIAAKFSPRRTIVLSFGFDEESSGKKGAGELSQFLQQKFGKNSFAAIVDEGAGFYNMWGRTFALPGVAEKGYLDVSIVVRMPGGHSSIPPDHNSIGVTSELVTLIENNLYEPRLHDENPYLSLLHCGAAHGNEFPSKLKKLLSRRSKKASCNTKDKLALEASKGSLDIKYLMTTSVAVDVIRGGVKVNALPERTEVTVNHRINVGERTTVVKDKLVSLANKVAAKYNLSVNAFNDADEQPSSITIRAGNQLEPAPVTPTSSDPMTPYAILASTTRALYGEEMIVSPCLMTGNTDTRFYWDLSPHIFRYMPGYDPEFEGLGRIHTVDEAISARSHLALIQWYSLFIRNMDEADLA
ncbi:uncharacterized protein PV09_05634 [Verruconis gallopava]|uniref:Peptidase M20 dimerisation domain-containing protein n=1 Tax=Verruconis gallopava TaxID=253628 RepID=A0A0D2A891_9PEZI|nr:uncharacterized protein PV09_05634 [Verruconis gallopava]KIW02973.1 hypothetical protein PV09_05634 [Verruconis gallopava]